MDPKRNFDLEYWKTSLMEDNPRALGRLINHFLYHKICPVSWDTLYVPLLLDLMI